MMINPPYEKQLVTPCHLPLQRVIRLGGAVDDDMANLIVAQLLYLDSTDSSKDITIYVNSPGGSVTAGMAIFDTMRHIRPDCSTVCVGLAASMGVSEEHFRTLAAELFIICMVFCHTQKLHAFPAAPPLATAPFLLLIFVCFAYVLFSRRRISAGIGVQGQALQPSQQPHHDPSAPGRSARASC